MISIPLKQKAPRKQILGAFLFKINNFKYYKVFKTSFIFLTAAALLSKAACSVAFNL